MNRIIKDDTVMITAGKSKGLTGKVLAIKGNRVLVEGANMVKKHVKPNPNLQQQGGIVEQEAFLHISNVGLLNPTTNKADRVGFKFVESEVKHKRKVRYFKSNDELVDIVK